VISEEMIKDLQKYLGDVKPYTPPPAESTSSTPAPPSPAPPTSTAPAPSK
jgi:hypothetical protein